MSNLGSKDTGKFELGVYEGSRLRGYSTINNLPAGETWNLKLVIAKAIEGTHNITVKADYKNVVSESNENNNEVSRDFEWRGIPNLKSEYLIVDQKAPFVVDKKVNFVFRVSNKGTGKTRKPCDIGILVDGKNYGGVHVKEFGTHKYIEIPFGLTFHKPGNYNIQIVADTEDDIDESNENDNIISENFEVEQWYYLDVPTDDNDNVRIYATKIGEGIEKNDKIRVKVIHSNNSRISFYEFENNIWSCDSEIVYNESEDPGAGVVTTVKLNSFMNGFVMNKIADKIVEQLYDKKEINSSELSQEDKTALLDGVLYSIDDNFFFGLARKLAFDHIFNASWAKNQYDDNYYYLLSRSFTDAVCTAALGTISAGSAAGAMKMVNSAGITASMTLAALPEGGVGVVLTPALVGELAGAAIAGGISFGTNFMFKEAAETTEQDVNAYKNCLGYKVRNVTNDILDDMEKKGGHTLENHVSKTNEWLIRRANKEGYNATSFDNKSTALKAIKEHMQKNADKIVKWINSNPTEKGIFNYSHKFELGKGVKAHTKNVIYHLKDSRLVLQPDKKNNYKFIITTFFPVLKK